MELSGQIRMGDGVSDESLDIERSNTLDRALRLSPSVDLESRLGLGVGWSCPSASGIGDEGIQNGLAITEEAAPDDRREDVEVRLESIDGPRVDAATCTLHSSHL